ncbi:ester cyclase [Conexibacter sp. SYSU D00693]|uniref:ester cyclase n=1 Tax=Conexibacter sp. SYSU D00693 TaxID=2812560 RepID=UPI00196A5BEB|nr:nuclear transport factor 2 family protein [Conexibacter sp. SYSU D00693]
MSAPVHELLEAIGGRSRHRLGRITTPDVHWEDPLTAEPLVGAEALSDHLARFWAAFPDGRVERIGDVLTGGRHAAAPVLVRGTHTGETSAELPPTGKELAMHAILWCELDGSQPALVRRARAFFDPADAGRQLGVLPARGGVGERLLLMLQGFGLRSPRP